MKKLLLALGLLAGGGAIQSAYALADTYPVLQKDVHYGYIVEKIWLTNYAMPSIALSNPVYDINVPLPANTPVAPAEDFKAILGMERKRPFVVVRVPVYAAGTQAGSANKLNSFKLTVTENQQAAKQAAKTTDITSSVLANGTWYKIGITQTGFYKIDYAFITSMGITPSSVSPSNMRVFGNGGHMLSENNAVSRPVDLLENAILMNDGGDNVFNSGDYAVFYATGPMEWDKDSTNQRFVHSKNLYSDTAYYFISFDQGAGLRVNSLPAVAGANQTVTSFNYYDVHDIDLLNPAGLGKTWYGEQFSSQLGNTSQVFNFDLGASASNVYCSVSFGGTSSISGNTVTASLNGNVVGTSGMSATSVDNVMSLVSVANTVACNSQTAAVTITYSPITSSDLGYLNYIELNTRRALTMNADQINFRDWQSVGSGNVASYQLQGATGSTQVWDVTNPQVPVIMSGSLSGSTYSFAQDASMLHEFAAMNNTNFYTPKYIGTVANQNLHGTGQVDCIIVTDKKFADQANRLASYHQSHDNMRVTVATTEQIYNEFSSGAQDISAIRDYERMFYKRAGSDTTQMPHYITLFGGSSYDYKNRLANNSDYVPVFESANSTDDIYGFSTDDFYGFLDDNENIEDATQLNAMDIGVGRLPARSISDATSLVDKVISYTSPAALGPWRVAALFAADNNDVAGQHMNDAEDMAACVTASSSNLYNENKVYIDAIPTVSTPAGDRCPNANAAIDDQVYKGVLLMNYNGHGNTEVWAAERILTQDDYNNWNNPNTLPFMVTATCDFGQFDHPQYVSAAEQLVIRDNGGVITVLTTTAAVYASYNHDINTQYLTAQFARKNDGSWNTFGEACRIGKNVTYAISVFDDRIANFRKFALLGDPALTPDFPKNAVYLDSITDVATQKRTDTIKALGAYVLNGSVRDNNGTTLTNFNGEISVSFYDKPRTITTISGTNETFQLQDNLVYRGKATVTNGLYSVTFITPKDINYYFGTGKLSTYAQNGETDGGGADTSVTVGGFSDNPVLSTTPPIVKPYISDSLFLNGGITGSNTSLYVSLYSETGINVAGTNLGHDLVGILDGNVEVPYILNDYYETAPNTYQRGSVSYPLTGLSDGRHSITVRAWDVNDNMGEGTVDFIVMDGQIVAIQNLMNYPNPFSNTTNFVFEHNHPDEQMDVNISIYNTAGSLVKKIEESFTPSGSRSNEITWDGTDNYGTRLPSGVYVYRLNIKTEKGFSSSAYQKLVIVR